MTSTASPMDVFIFLDNAQAKNKKLRTKVRSRAAVYSHQSGTRKPRRPNVRQPGADIILRVRDGKDPAPRAETKGGAGEPDQPVDCPQNAASPKPSKADDSDVGGSQELTFVVTPPSPASTTIGLVAEDPFEIYPVASKPWYPKLLFHLAEFTKHAWTDLPTTAEERWKGQVYVHRQTRSEATYFYMNLLSVAVSLLDRGQIEDKNIPIWLTAQVVAALNTALSHRETALSAATIMTVWRLAHHEILLGDWHAGKHIHRPAFARMIVLAGGVDALDLPELVHCSWSWAERLMTQRTGDWIGDLEPSLANERIFQDSRHLRNEDLSVLSAYFPKRKWDHATNTLPIKMDSPAAAG